MLQREINQTVQLAPGTMAFSSEKATEACQQPRLAEQNHACNKSHVGKVLVEFLRIWEGAGLKELHGFTAQTH